METIGEITDVVFHHSASVRDTTKLETIQQWHLDKGWRRIGYHWVIESAPVRVRPCHPLYELGIHVRGQNTGKLGVCIVGDNRFDDQRWTPEQIGAGLRLYQALRELLPGIGYGGHRDYDRDRTCPEVDVRWLFSIAAEGGALRSLDAYYMSDFEAQTGARLLFDGGETNG